MDINKYFLILFIFSYYILNRIESSGCHHCVTAGRKTWEAHRSWKPCPEGVSKTSCITCALMTETPAASEHRPISLLQFQTYGDCLPPTASHPTSLVNTSPSTNNFSRPRLAAVSYSTLHLNQTSLGSSFGWRVT